MSSYNNQVEKKIKMGQSKIKRGCQIEKRKKKLQTKKKEASAPLNLHRDVRRCSCGCRVGAASPSLGRLPVLVAAMGSCASARRCWAVRGEHGVAAAGLHFACGVEAGCKVLPLVVWEGCVLCCAVWEGCAFEQNIG